MFRTMKPIVLTLLTIAAVSWLIAGAPTRSRTQSEKIVPASGPIKGKVLLPDGKAAVKARVTFVSQINSPGEALAETFTDASGEFAFENPKWPELGQPEPKLIVEAEGCGLSFRGLAD